MSSHDPQEQCTLPTPQPSFLLHMPIFSIQSQAFSLAWWLCLYGLDWGRRHGQGTAMRVCVRACSCPLRQLCALGLLPGLLISSWNCGGWFRVTPLAPVDLNRTFCCRIRNCVCLLKNQQDMTVCVCVCEEMGQKSSN